MTPRIVCLASYPKSGNTWLRVYLSNLTADGTDPSDINALRYNACSYSREVLDKTLNIDTGNLTPEECAEMRPLALRWINQRLQQVQFCKVHESNHKLANDDWLFPPDVIDKVVYILRNPLDVAVSQAHHSSITLDRAIDRLGDTNECLARQISTRQLSHLEQPLGSWSMHVKSWVDTDTLNTLVVRYEDMHLKPHETFGKITAFLGVAADRKTQERAISDASFDKLRKQEDQHGFAERPGGVERFFRNGQIGEGLNRLSGRQIDKVIKDHGSIMQRFGYATSDGTPHLSEC